MRYVLESARGRKQGLRIPIKEKVFVIGAARNSQVRSVKEGVGRKHCALVVHKKKLYVQDLESGYPTFVNGTTMTPGGRLSLKAGDHVALGPMEFIIKPARKRRRAGIPVSLPHAAPAAPPAPSFAPMPDPSPLDFLAAAPSPLRSPPSQNGLSSSVRKPLALTALAVVCMGVGCLLFLGPLGRTQDNKDGDEEEKRVERDSKKGTPDPRDRKGADRLPQDKKAPERKPPTEEKKPPTEVKKPPVAEKKPSVEEKKPSVEEKKPPVEEKKPPPRKPPMEDGPRVTFAGEIQPILKARCISCHNSEKQRGKLDASSIAALLKGGKNGPAIRPGSLEGSLLWEAIDNDTMPPTEPKLSDAEKKLFKDWILGAKSGTLAAK